jgi:hypothetical protein
VTASRQPIAGWPAHRNAGAGNLLIAAEPALLALRPQERQPLLAWLRRGNALLLVRDPAAAFDETMLGWFGLSSNRFVRDTQCQARVPQAPPQAGDGGAMIGSLLPPAAADPRPTPQLAVLMPSAADQRLAAVFTGVRAVAYAEPQRDPLALGIHGRADPPPDALLRDAGGNAALYHLRFGRGQIWISAFGLPFANAWIDRGDNAQLFANLAEYTLQPGGAVVFDDLHQGDSLLYDPQAFYADPRLYRSVAIVFALWVFALLAYRGRAAAPAAVPVPNDLLAFAQRLAAFYARSLHSRAIAEDELQRLRILLRARLRSAA